MMKTTCRTCHFVTSRVQTNVILNTLDMDRYTPCISRPTEEHARRRNIDHRRASYHETVLRHFSRFLEQQESSITQLMRNFDIDVGGDASCDREGITGLDESSFSSPFSNMAPSSFPMLSPAPQSDKPRSTKPSAPFSRPGRLSPSTIKMVLSSNTSTVSGISSAADTSYDSGLYQWLGVQTDAAPKTTPGIPPMLSEPFDDSANLDMSMMSSGSAYSRLSPESRIVLPLSPPATALPPFSDTLRGEPTACSLPRAHGSSSQHLASLEPNQMYQLRNFTTSNNLPFQHYMPSALILRHFQQVIDELRGLYVPNDMGNNAPNPDRARAFLSSRQALPGSYIISPCRVSCRRSSHNSSDSVTQPQRSAVRPTPPIVNNIYRDSRTTREMYTEMAVILFSQVSNEEAQVTNLQVLVNRLEALANRKRKVALVIGTWGREGH